MTAISVCRKIVVSLVIGLWPATAGSLPVALGQETTPAPPPAEGSEEVTSADLTTEVIDAQIQRIEASTNLDESTKSELLSLYAEALEALKAAANSAAAAAQFEQRRQAAPAELADIQARLEQARSQPVSQPAAELPVDASLEVLSERLNNARAEFEERTKALRQVDDQLRRRSERRRETPIELEAASVRLEEVTRALVEPAASGVDAEIAVARRTVLSARLKAAEQQISTFKEELRYWEAMGDLLNARRDEARGQVAQAEAVVTAWTAAVTRRRQGEAEDQRRQAQAQLADAPAPIRGLAESNAELADERLKLTTDIDELASKSRDVTKTIDTLEEKLAYLSEKAETPGMDAFIGPRLLQERRQLPDVHAHQRQIRALENRASAIQRRLFELQELRATLTDIDAVTAELSQQVLQDQPTLNANELQGMIREVLQTRLDTVRSLQKDCEECWNNIVALNLLNNRLVARTQNLASFINQRILWVRSHPPLHRAELPKGGISSWPVWRTMGRGLWADATARSGAYLMLGAALLLWLVLWRPARNRLRNIDQRVMHRYSDAAGLTSQSLCLEAWLAAPIPILMLFLGARLAWAIPVSDPTAYELAQGLSAGLRGPAAAVFMLLFLWRLCRRGGIGEVQFQWGPQAMHRLHRPLLLVVLIGGAAGFMHALASSHPDSAWRDSVARGAFYVAILSAMYLIHVMLHPKRGAIAVAAGAADQGKLRSAAGVRYLLTIVILFAPVVISAAGYHFTAVRFGQIVSRTLALIIALVILRAMILRFVRVSQQKVAIAQARKEMARRAAERAEGDDHSAEPPPLEEEEAFEVQPIDEQVLTLVRWLVVFTLIAGIWVVWKDVVPAFSFLNRIELWSYTVTSADGTGAQSQMLTRMQGVYLSDLLIALLVGAATIVLATNMPSILELLLFARLSIEPSVRFAATALCRYAIVIVGLIVAFGSIGIGWQQVQFLAAAITVGLGFGLQEIFANFVSGLIILFERPVRIGDTVTVGSVSGQVTRIRIRATTVTDWDNRELIVPNKEFITAQITNWTLSSPVTRAVIPVGIAYGSDTALAREVLVMVARECEYVMDDPGPSAIFRNFGASSLDFDLRVYIAKRGLWPQMIDDMHARIDAAFRKAKIEIAFPQRDVHVRSIQDVLPVNQRPGTESSAGHEVVEGGRAAGKD